jgi:hypothetical protein
MSLLVLGSNRKYSDRQEKHCSNHQGGRPTFDYYSDKQQTTKTQTYSQLQNIVFQMALPLVDLNDSAGN